MLLYERPVQKQTALLAIRATYLLSDLKRGIEQDGKRYMEIFNPYNTPTLSDIIHHSVNHARGFVYSIKEQEQTGNYVKKGQNCVASAVQIRYN